MSPWPSNSGCRKAGRGGYVKPPQAPTTGFRRRTFTLCWSTAGRSAVRGRRGTEPAVRDPRGLQHCRPDMASRDVGVRIPAITLVRTRTCKGNSAWETHKSSSSGREPSLTSRTLRRSPVVSISLMSQYRCWPHLAREPSRTCIISHSYRLAPSCRLAASHSRRLAPPRRLAASPSRRLAESCKPSQPCEASSPRSRNNGSRQQLYTLVGDAEVG